jgi:hypothetical protein
LEERVKGKDRGNEIVIERGRERQRDRYRYR